MNRILKKFCEVELDALNLYSDGYKPKNEVYDILNKKFGKSYQNVILLGLEAAAQANNFHNDSGPWMRDLKVLAGFFTIDDLNSMRHFVKFE